MSRDARERFLYLAAAGPGWHPYVIEAAERLSKENPVAHEGLVAAVEEAIGPAAVKSARKALKWFARHPAQGAAR